MLKKYFFMPLDSRNFKDLAKGFEFFKNLEAKTVLIQLQSLIKNSRMDSCILLLAYFDEEKLKRIINLAFTSDPDSLGNYIKPLFYWASGPNESNNKEIELLKKQFLDFLFANFSTASEVCILFSEDNKKLESYQKQFSDEQWELWARSLDNQPPRFLYRPISLISKMPLLKATPKLRLFLPGRDEQTFNDIFKECELDEMTILYFREMIS